MKNEMSQAQIMMVRQKNLTNKDKTLKDDDSNLLQQNTMPVVTFDFRTSAWKIHFSWTLQREYFPSQYIY